MSFSRLAALALTFPLAAAGQEAPSTILVLDASGSMWGQIDGVNKIVIARDVVGRILADFPEAQNLGLTVYGHRLRGDCTDIETLIPPAPGTAAEIAAAVNAINPRGMTPMTDAVIAAAEALRHTENRATVILVSDGIETCNPDPCAAARALEAAGVDFTAHVVGFDVGSDPEALAQMQCIAEETGGLFLAAADAAELSAAMATMAEAAAAVEPAPPAEPEPAPLPVRTTFLAQDTGGATLAGAVTWEITGPAGPVSRDSQPSGYTTDLLPAAYTLRAVRDSDGAAVELAFTVAEGTAGTVTAVFPALLPEASLDAPASAPAGSTLAVGWTGPDAAGDYIEINLEGAEGWLSYVYTERGSPADLPLPPEPGAYELRYAMADGTILASRPITLTEVELALLAPDSAPAGSTLAVGWVGPDAAGDNIQVGLPGSDAWADYAYTSRGNPVTLILPWEPGTYELRYRFRDAETILTRPLTVTPGTVSITAPDSAPAGSVVRVEWEGPAAPGDNLQVAEIGGSWLDYAYVTAGGGPVELVLPSTPGDYELRYAFRDRDVILTRPITATPVGISLSAPAAATAGTTVPVTWVGPGGEADYIEVNRPGVEGWITYEYVNRGNPVDVPLPVEPGAYELRYVSGADRVVGAVIPLELLEVKASVAGPATAAAGAMIEVAWTGPAGPSDYVAIGLPEGGYVTYEYVNRGNPVTVAVPDAAGAYVIRYFQGGSDIPVAEAPLTVTGK